MDLATILGLIAATIGIVGGLILEGGNVMQITQPTAMLIVMGGTIGAALVQFPLPDFIRATKSGIQLLKPHSEDPGEIIEELVKFSNKARKEGIVSLEADAKEIKDEFFKKAMMMVIDGAEPNDLRDSLENQLFYMKKHGTVVSKVWEACGGYAPTIGIIGAVMGLIQVMQNLEDIEAVGSGIAVAFVATIYGVALSNIVFLPGAGKLHLAHEREIVVYEMIVEGVLLVIEGVNPLVMRDKLSSYFVDKVVKEESA